MRIIHGKYKYRKIDFIKHLKFSPINSAIRESIFNVLKNYLNWEKTKICDLFAGSGILGLEALSWGGNFCFFNDIDQKSCDILKKNLQKMKINSNLSKIFTTSYSQFIAQLKKNKELLDLIFIDPPYQKKHLVRESVQEVIKQSVLNNNAILVAKTKQEKIDISTQKEIYLLKTKKYGDHYVHFWQFNSDKKQPEIIIKNNKLIIISGPSGVGKKTVITRLLNEAKLNLTYSVSLTTRAPRKNEKDGLDYYFINNEEFEKEIADNNFIEYAKYIDKYYGTSKTYVQRLLNQEKNVILEIEIIGAIKVKKKFPKAIWIFLLPPTFDDLKKRIEKRFQKAKEEINWVTGDNLCDHFVINDKIEETITEIKKILEKQVKIHD